MQEAVGPAVNDLKKAYGNTGYSFKQFQYGDGAAGQANKNTGYAYREFQFGDIPGRRLAPKREVWSARTDIRTPSPPLVRAQAFSPEAVASSKRFVAVRTPQVSRNYALRNGSG